MRAAIRSKPLSSRAEGRSAVTPEARSPAAGGGLADEPQDGGWGVGLGA
jgi:hypothetical protein